MHGGYLDFRDPLHPNFSSFFIDLHVLLDVGEGRVCHLGIIAFLRKQSFPQGATPVKKFHSAVPHENSAFKNFACASLILYCERISPI